MKASSNPLRRFKNYAAIIGFIMTIPLAAWYIAVSAAAPEGTLLDLAGYQGPAYPASVEDPTQSIPESKLWWNDGIWWGVLYGVNSGKFTIHRYDWSTKDWVDTGVDVDSRLTQTFDTLWDETDEKLYIVSHKFDDNPNQSGPTEGAELLRYTYDASVQTYTRDSGFPVTIAEHQTESVTLAKDSTGQLWITFVSIADGDTDFKIFVNRSIGDDLTWGTPFSLGVVDREDVSAVVAFTDNSGAKIGVGWSELNSKFHFAYHLDANADDTVWTEESAFDTFGLANDKVNLAAYNGEVYMAVTTLNALDTDPGNAVLRRTADGSWSLHPVTIIDDSDSHPIAVVDEGDPTVTGDEYLYVFMSGHRRGSYICYQRALLTSLNFGGGNCKGEADGAQVPFIADSDANLPDYADFHYATSSKNVLSQNVTGLLVLASSEDAIARTYGHNDLGDPIPVVNPRFPDFNEVVDDTALVEVTFNRAMDPTTLTTSSFIVEGPAGPIAGSVSYNSATKVATFTPNPGLIAGLDYTVKLTSAIKDTTGRELREGITSGTIREQWDFSVEGTAVQFDPVVYTVDEDAGVVTLTAELTKAAANVVTVNYASASGSATATNDFVPISGTLIFNPGELVKTFQTSIVDDAVVETSENFNVVLSNPSNASLGPDSSAIITILDNEGVEFAATNFNVTENDGIATVTVVLSGPSSQVVSVGYETSDGTATQGSDYTPTSGTLVFGVGEVSKTFNITLLDDGHIDDQETINLALINPINVSLGAISTATVTIGDDEGVQLSSATYVVNETSGTADITVQLTGAAPAIVSVDYTTSDATATAGSDYTATSGTLIFNAGEVSKVISVPISNDAFAENTETFNFTLNNAINVPLGSPSTAVVTIVDNETVEFSSANYSVAEDGGSITIVVQLGGSPQAAAHVDYTTSNGTATAGSDYTAKSGTLIFNPGETTKSFSIPILNDADVEPTETINLTLSNPVNTELGTNDTAVVTIVDDENVSFTTANYDVNEQDGTVTITAILSGASTSTVSVGYETFDGTAVAGNDYTSATGTLTFSPGQTVKVFTVPILDDGFIEAAETFNVRLKNPVDVTLGSLSQATVTINDNEDVHLSQAAYLASESNAQVTITVELSAVSPGGVTVNYATSDDTAQAGSDYTAVGGTLTFAAGEQFKTFTVPILNDDFSETSEVFNVNLSAPTNVQLGTPNTAQVTIIDNETIQLSSTTYGVNEAGGFAAVTVQLAGPAQASVFVDYNTADVSANAGSDYSVMSGTLEFVPGETSKTINIPIIDDTVVEAQETFKIFLSNPVNTILGTNDSATITITDNEGIVFSSAAFEIDEFTPSAVITVELVGTASNTVTVHYTSMDNTAMAGSDYTGATQVPLVFNPGETSKTFTVPILNDTIFEGDEVLNLVLANPINGTLGAQSTATLTIRDDEDPITVSFTETNVNIDEFGGSASLTVNLSGASQADVTVDYATFDGTAVAGSDYTASSGTLTFTSGETSKVLNVSIIDDSEAESTESLTVNLTNPTNAVLGTIASETVTIFDDENAPRVQFNSATFSAGEGDGTATIEVVLSKIVLSSVSIDYMTTAGTATNGSDYTGTSGTLLFAPGETTKTFDIDILEDGDPETNETVVLTLSNPVNAFLGAPSTANLTIVDNESKVQFTSATYNYTETDGTVLVEVAIVPPATSAVSIDLVMTPGTATPNADYIDASRTLNFVPGEQDKKVFISLFNDDLDEANETINLTLTNLSSSGAVFMGLDEALFTIEDNDVAPTLRLNTDSITVDEEEQTIELEVLLSTGSGQQVTVDYTTGNGTAEAGLDFTGGSGTLTFVPGELSKTILIDILEDTVDEVDETLSFTMANPVNATFTVPNRADITIIDDDATPSVSLASSSYSVNEDGSSIDVEVHLSAPSGRTVTVDYATSDATATDGLDYIGQSGTFTFAPGETAKMMTILVLNDVLDEPAETVNIILSNVDGAVLGAPATAQLAIADDDAAPIVRFTRATEAFGEDAGIVNIEAVLSEPSSFEVTVGYSATSVTAVTPGDYILVPGQLTFAPGTTSQLIPVQIVDDSEVESTETVKLTLSNATNAGLDGFRETIVEVVDNDSNAPTTVGFSQTQYDVAETAGTVLVEVRLSSSTDQTVSVNYFVTPGTAGTGDYNANASGTLTFAPGEISKSVVINIVDDIFAEGTETIDLSLGDAVGVSIGTNQTSVVRIQDNDTGLIQIFLPNIIRN